MIALALSSPASHAAPLSRVSGCSPCAAKRQAAASNRVGAQTATLEVVPADECAGTGTKIAYGVGGALLGFAAGWMLNDERKGKIKAGAKARAAAAADRAAARLRR